MPLVRFEGTDESTTDAKGNSVDGLVVYPIQISWRGVERLSLGLTKEADRRNLMDQIMKAQNYSHQLDQYATIEPLGSTTIKA